MSISPTGENRSPLQCSVVQSESSSLNCDLFLVCLDQLLYWMCCSSLPCHRKKMLSELHAHFLFLLSFSLCYLSVILVFEVMIGHVNQNKWGQLDSTPTPLFKNNYDSRWKRKSTFLLSQLFFFLKKETRNLLCKFLNNAILCKSMICGLQGWFVLNFFFFPQLLIFMSNFYS